MKRRRLLLGLLIGLGTASPALAQNQMFPGDHGSSAPVGGGPVTRWTIAADELGGGTANWRTLAIMHVAMHDAINAAVPRYRRWAPTNDTQPSGAGSDDARLDGAGVNPHVAMAAAAYRVLLARHPETAPLVADLLFRAALADEAAGPATDAAIRLGTAIAGETLAAYAISNVLPRPFQAGEGAGEWRPTPPDYVSSVFVRLRPFLPVSGDAVGGRPPNPSDSPRFLRDVAEVNRIGALDSIVRTPEQTDAAIFWAGQSSQRGFVRLAVDMIRARPLPGGSWDEARAMAVVAVALADSAVLTWEEKERYRFWRPVTVIRLGIEGTAADPAWQPLIHTPPHPDHPSAHAADCSAGATALIALFGDDSGPITYFGLSRANRVPRDFRRLSDIAAECAMSRLWAGVHFRAANEEGLRLGAEIATRALATVPSLSSPR